MEIQELKVTIGQVYEATSTMLKKALLVTMNVLIFAQSISESSFIKTSSGTR